MTKTSTSILDQKWRSTMLKGALDNLILFLEENPDFEFDVYASISYLMYAGSVESFRYLCKREGLVISQVVKMDIFRSCSDEAEWIKRVELLKDCLLPMNYEEKEKFFNEVLSGYVWRSVIEVVKDGVLEADIIIAFLKKAKSNLLRFLMDVREIGLRTLLTVEPILKEMIIDVKEDIIEPYMIRMWCDFQKTSFLKGKVLVDVLKENLTERDIEILFCYMCAHASVEDINWFLSEVDHNLHVENIEGREIINNEFHHILMDPLSEACKTGCVEVVKWLIETYDLDITRFNNRALRMAFFSGQLGVLKLIHEKYGLDVDVINSVSFWRNFELVTMAEWLEGNVPGFQTDKLINYISQHTSDEDEIVWLLRRKIPVSAQSICCISDPVHLQLLLDSYPNEISEVYKRFLISWVNDVPLTIEILDKFKKGMNEPFEEKLLLELCSGSSLENIKLLLSREPKISLAQPFIESCQQGFLEKVEYFYSHMQDVDLEVMVKAFCSAGKTDCVHVIDWLVKVCPDLVEESHIQKAMASANGLTMMKHLYSLYPIDLSFDNNSLFWRAVQDKRLKTAIWILQITGAEEILQDVNDPFVERVLASVKNC